MNEDIDKRLREYSHALDFVWIVTSTFVLFGIRLVIPLQSPKAFQEDRERNNKIQEVVA